MTPFFNITNEHFFSLVARWHLAIAISSNNNNLNTLGNASTAQGTNRAKKNTTKSSQELRVTWTEYSFVKSFIKLLTLSPCADKNQ